MTSKLKIALNSASFLTGVLVATGASAQDNSSVAAPQAEGSPAPELASDGPEIIVTGTRRATTLQNTPINISAVTSDVIDQQRLDDVRDIAAFVPGITITDGGAGSTGKIVMRGLTANGGIGADEDDALAIYLGEVPLYYDFKLLDLERVEVLLGPQGTLYGAGTLAGAVRYIPNRPDPNSFEGEVHSRVYGKGHSDQIGFQADFAVNIPIVKNHIAFRTASGYYFDPGFIDHPLVLREPGVSLPQAGGVGNVIGPHYEANLRKVEDLNFEKTLTTRNQLLLQLNDNIKGIITYAYQQTRTDGGQSNSAGVLGTGKYENASRWVEPLRRRAHLVSIELNANLWGIADLVATTAYTSKLHHVIVGEKTDELIDLELGYEAFPSFAAYYNSENRNKQVNAEVRLVSRHGGLFNWTLGGFYNRQKNRNFYVEIAPGLPEFYGVSDGNPDDIEYSSFTNSNITEKAIFGEATFEITPNWQVTGGARYFKYNVETLGAIVLPILGDPLSPFDVPSSGGKAGASGWVWKVNTSYRFSPELMTYVTYSKGYRIGGPNYVGPCPDPLPPGQQVACALPDEVQYGPDTTKNFEIGVRGDLFRRRLNLNFNIFRIKWDGIQLATQTVNGGVGITGNGGTARSQGFEVSAVARPTDRLTLQGVYSYLDAKLTSDVPRLISFRSIPGVYGSGRTRIDALSGDRLPGSPKNSGSLGATYTYPLGDAELIGNWTAVYRGAVLSRLAWERAFGERIPSYVTHRASLTYSTERYDLSLFANNIFDKYAVISIGNNLSQVGVKDGVAVRYYSRSVLTPRTFGIEARVKF